MKHTRHTSLFRMVGYYLEWSSRDTLESAVEDVLKASPARDVIVNDGWHDDHYEGFAQWCMAPGKEARALRDAVVARLVAGGGFVTCNRWK